MNGIFLDIDATALSRAPFGQGTGPIHVDDLMCSGNESTLFGCPYNPTHNCNHFEDAGVRCSPERTQIAELLVHIITIILPC